tara:strand:+ start:1787 stop:2515 length:729 start_codon:yes stop_codon:yes gene_type:complete
MGYFRELPNVAVSSRLIEKRSSQEYVIAKNIFRRIKILNSISDNVSLYNKYQIYEGERPDTVAKELYDNSELDYVVILSAGITNIRDQWPLSNHFLYEYALEKYGEKLNALHHYETVEVRDQWNRLILPAGLTVDETFKINGPGNQFPVGTQWKAMRDTGSLPLSQNTLGGSASDLLNTIAVGISNYEYEDLLNEEKRQINVLKPVYLQQFLEEFRRIMFYDRNSQYISKNLITTENTTLVN